MTKKEKISKLLRIDELEIPKLSVFVEHRYLQHVGSARRGYHTLGHHAYLIPVSYDFTDAEALAYGVSFSGRRPSVSGTEDYSAQQA